MGPLRVTARAPEALARRRACAGGVPRSQWVTKVAAKVSPAPVGSTSSTAKAGAARAPLASWREAPAAPCLTTTVRMPRARRARAAVASSSAGEKR